MQNRIAPDGTPRSAASHLGLYCLPMSTKGTQGLNELRVILFFGSLLSSVIFAGILLKIFKSNSN